MSSKILKTVHETAQGLHDADEMDLITMREFDTLCLKPVKKMAPKQIKKLRLHEGVSQPVFAFYLNVSPSTVKKWESGEKMPSGVALRLLKVVEQNGLNILITLTKE